MSEHEPTPMDMAVTREVVRRMPSMAWRVQARLLDFARPEGLPEDRDSRNPVRWLAGEAGRRIQDRIIRQARDAALSGRKDQP